MSVNRRSIYCMVMERRQLSVWFWLNSLVGTIRQFSMFVQHTEPTKRNSCTRQTGACDFAAGPLVSPDSATIVVGKNQLSRRRRRCGDVRAHTHFLPKHTCTHARPGV